MKMIKDSWILGAVAIFMLIMGCEKEDVVTKEFYIDSASLNLEEKSLVYNTFLEWYLWNEEIPLLNLDKYETPQDVFDAIIYEPYDRFSIVTSLTEFNRYYQDGEYYGHGFSLGFDVNAILRVRYIYENTPIYEAGVRRGWRLEEINGKDTDTIADIIGEMGPDEEGIANSFLFVSQTGDSVSGTFSKAIVEVPPVMHSEIIEVNQSKVGYLVLNDFIEETGPAMETIFSGFNSENVGELVLDIRYNRGGVDSIANLLVNYIAGSAANNEVYSRTVHNEDKSNLNQEDTIRRIPNSLDIDRVFILTGFETASTSEVIINGLNPLMEVHQIGYATAGIPVGRYLLVPGREYIDLAILPVTFKNTNKKGEGDYFEGIEPEQWALDDLSREFGNPSETLLRNALNYIRFGRYLQFRNEAVHKSSSIDQIDKKLDYKGLKKLTGKL